MIIVSALDNSGQQHAGELVRVLRRELDGESFVGIGGRDLAGAGCTLIHDTTDNSAMLGGVVASLRWALPAYRRLVKLIDAGDVKMVILVDSPTFNLPLARAAKKRGVKTFYYIAPQVWAWGRFRITKIKARVDRLAVILPFEERFFRDHDIDAHFVGHPFIHHLKESVIDPDLSARLTALEGQRLVIMPGSRRGVIRQVLPVQLRVLQALQQRVGPIRPYVVAWPGGVADIQRLIRRAGLVPCDNTLPDTKHQIGVFTTHRATLIRGANLALAASGTGTLEAAWHGRPMIVMYNASRWGYHLVARWLIRVEHLSLINILAGRQLVPEFMPYIRDERQIISAAQALLTDKERSAALGGQLRELVAELGTAVNPAERTAQLALDLLRT